jgi:hypothetical protein
MMNLPLNLTQALSGGNPPRTAPRPRRRSCCWDESLLSGTLSGSAGSCCSVPEQQTIRRSFANAVAFVLGIAIAIAARGSIAAYVGRIAEIGTPVEYVIAVIPTFMGMYRLGWVKLPAFSPKPFQLGFGGAFGTGLLLSLVIGPCGTHLSLLRSCPMRRTRRVSCTAGCCYSSTAWGRVSLWCWWVRQQEVYSRDSIAAAMDA